MAVKVREKVKGSGEWWIFIDHKIRPTMATRGRSFNLDDPREPDGSYDGRV